MQKRTQPFRTLRALAFPAAALLITACAGAGQPGAESAPAPAATAARTALPVLQPTVPPADLGAAERFAWQQTVQLGEAFAAGDVDGFLARVSRGFYRGYGKLETSLRRLLEGSSARGAVISVLRISEDSGKLVVRAEWTRSVTRRDGVVDARYGQTDFIYIRSDSSLRLIDYRGNAPFAIDGI